MQGGRTFDKRALRLATSLASGAVLAVGLGAPAALAQDVPGPDEPFVLDTIEVIYGARDATTLQDTSASVGVVDAEEIETRDIDSFRDAFRLLGNVIDADWLDAGFIIRGVNSEGLVPGGAPLASVYVDGIQQTLNAARRGSRGLWDVEQVEVYRGPQSTLSGRAALAGAIYVKTKDPVFEREAAVQAEAGNFDRRGGAFMVNTPIGDQAALRVAGEYERSESDLNYPTYGGLAGYDNLVEDEYYQIRGKLLVTPDEMPDTRALVTYAFAHDSPTLDDIAGPGLGFAFSERRGDFNLPVFSEPRENDVHNIGFEVTHDFSELLRFTSLSAFNDSSQDRSSVNAGTPGETNVTIGEQNQSLFTQEFRLNYESGPWEAVGGVYGAYETGDQFYRRPDYFGRSDFSSQDDSSVNLAAFGEATYEFVPTWKVTGGLRADYLERETQAFFSRNGLATTDDDLDYDELVLLPKVGLSKDLTPDQTVGVTVQRGFRNGGVGVLRNTGEVYTYDPEFTWNYELFYKGTFLEDRLTLNANVFYQDWSDQQVEVQTIPGDFTSNRVVNAASSRSHGFEIEGNYKIVAGLSAFASLGFVETEFLEFEDANLGDVSGLPFPEAPEWTFAVGAVYEHESGVFVGADAKYVSSYLARFGNAPQEFLDERVIANVQLGYRGERFEVVAYADNVFDEEYFVYNDNDIAATLGDRREYGVRAKVKF